jgi:hypothetical protein
VCVCVYVYIYICSPACVVLNKKCRTTGNFQNVNDGKFSCLIVFLNVINLIHLYFDEGFQLSIIRQSEHYDFDSRHYQKKK